MECIFFRLSQSKIILVYCQLTKIECQLKRIEHFQHLLLNAFIKGSKAAKVADFYYDDFYQLGIENIVQCWEEVVNNN